MTQPTTPVVVIAKRSYTLDEAEAAYGINKRQLQRAREAGLLTFTYPLTAKGVPSRRPIIRDKDMDSYLDSSPTYLD